MKENEHATAQRQEFGRRVHVQRKKLGLSQEAFGELSDLHRTYVGRLERGDLNPSLLNILKVAAALEIDAGELLRDLTQGRKVSRRS